MNYKIDEKTRRKIRRFHHIYSWVKSYDLAKLFDVSPSTMSTILNEEKK